MSTTTTTYALVKPALHEADWGNPRNANMDTVDAELSRTRQPFNAPAVGATTTLDCSLARCFVFTVSQITTVAITNPPAATFFTRLLAIITNGNAFAVTWPASVVWLGGGTPTLKTSGVDIIELVTKDAGVTWYGARFDSQRDTLGSSTVDVGTGAATIETTLHTIAVPAGVMGKNGAIRITVDYTLTGGAGAKTLRIKYGGTTFQTDAYGAGDAFVGQAFIVITNRNATNSQLARGYATTNTGGVLLTTASGAVDTTVAQNVIVTGETPNAADEMTANVTIVELLNPSL